VIVSSTASNQGDSYEQWVPPSTCKLTAPLTRNPVAEIACMANLGVTFVDVCVEAVGTDCFITAELSQDVDAWAAGQYAQVLIADLLGFF
jgi:hypothetical protein